MQVGCQRGALPFRLAPEQTDAVMCKLFVSLQQSIDQCCLSGQQASILQVRLYKNLSIEKGSDSARNSKHISAGH